MHTYKGLEVQIVRDHKTFTTVLLPVKHKHGKSKFQAVKKFAGWANILPKGQIIRTENRLLMRQEEYNEFKRSV